MTKFSSRHGYGFFFKLKIEFKKFFRKENEWGWISARALWPPDLKGVLLSIVMAALKCATRSCVSKVKWDAHAL